MNKAELAQLNQLLGEFREFKKTCDMRFDQIDEHFRNIDNRLAQPLCLFHQDMAAKLDRLGERDEEHDGKINELEKRDIGIEAKLTRGEKAQLNATSIGAAAIGVIEFLKWLMGR